MLADIVLLQMYKFHIGFTLYVANQRSSQLVSWDEVAITY